MPVDLMEPSLVSAGSDRVGDRLLVLSWADDFLASSSAIALDVCAKSAVAGTGKGHISNLGLASSEDRGALQVTLHVRRVQMIRAGYNSTSKQAY